MPRKLLLATALIAGTTYFFSDRSTHDALHIVCKGSGVGLLAVWAALVAQSRDRRLLTAAFAVYASADVLLEFGMIPGAAAFMLGHGLMISLYLRHRRPLMQEDWMIAGLILAAVPVASFLLADDHAAGFQVALYAVMLGAMAAAAWLSDFRRDRVWLGAMLFVASDLLIFARMGSLRHSAVPDLGVWPLYFAGQVLVVTGVAAKLERRR